MKQITGYIRQYFYETDKKVLLLVSLFTGLLVFANYHYGIDNSISHSNSFPIAFIIRYGIFLAAFAVPYLLYTVLKKENYIYHPRFAVLLIIAPAIFSLKTSLSISTNIATSDSQNDYWNHVIYWPLHLVIIISILFIIWKTLDKDQPFYGTKSKGINWKPYLLMLIIMLPLIAAASTQQDFLVMYPKIKTITENGGAGITWWHKLLF